MAMTLEGPFRRRRARGSAAWALLLPNDMRWAMVAGILALAGRAVSAAYLVELNPGDRIQIGSTIFRYVAGGGIGGGHNTIVSRLSQGAAAAVLAVLQVAGCLLDTTRRS